MREVVITSAARLAVGKLGGSLKDTKEVDMGAPVIAEAIKRSRIKPEDVDEVIMAQNYRSGEISGNSSRVYALKAGIPLETPQFTISKHCGGGIRAVTLAAQIIKSGEANIIVAGGVESMSRSAFLVPGVRWGKKVGHGVFQDQLVLYDPICGLTMGETAEKVAKDFEISREEQDEFAFESQQKAEMAIKEGKFKDQILPITIRTKNNEQTFEVDEFPRFGTKLENLSKLPPAFIKDGTVTAGNASGMNDGASALVVMSSEKAKELGVKPLAKIKAYASAGVDPAIMGTGPVPATFKALEKAKLSIKDIDLFELNEAFASICIYFLRETKADPTKLNIYGGAIALGHPVSATGGVILSKLLYALEEQNKQFGLATMCIGGGQGIALIVDRDV